MYVTFLHHLISVAVAILTAQCQVDFTAALRPVPLNQVTFHNTLVDANIMPFHLTYRTAPYKGPEPTVS